MTTSFRQRRRGRGARPCRLARRQFSGTNPRRRNCRSSGYRGRQTFCPQVTRYRFTSGHHLRCDDRVERLLGLVGRSRHHPAETVGDAVDVGIDADVLRAPVRQDQHQVRGLPSDARQRQQLAHGPRHPSAEPAQDLAARVLHVDGLVPIEADRIDEPLDLLDGQLRDAVRRACDARTTASRRRASPHRASAPTASSRSAPGTDRLPDPARSSRPPARRGRRWRARGGA